MVSKNVIKDFSLPLVVVLILVSILFVERTKRKFPKLIAKKSNGFELKQ